MKTTSAAGSPTQASNPEINRWTTSCCSFLSLLLSGIAAASDYFDETKATTLFAFDDVSIPYSQNLRLEMRQPLRYVGNPVVRRGAPGTPDAHGVQFYGSIIKEHGKYRLWYVAFDDNAESKAPSARWRAAYAESIDGVAWTKPNLGLVEFNGNRTTTSSMSETPGDL